MENPPEMIIGRPVMSDVQINEMWKQYTFQSQGDIISLTRGLSCLGLYKGDRMSPLFLDPTRFKVYFQVTKNTHRERDLIDTDGFMCVPEECDQDGMVHITTQKTTRGSITYFRGGALEGKQFELMIKMRNVFGCTGDIIRHVNQGTIVRLSGDHRTNVTKYLLHNRLCDRKSIRFSVRSFKEQITDVNIKHLFPPSHIEPVTSHISGSIPR